MRRVIVLSASALAATPATAQFLPNDQSLVTFNRYVAVRQRQPVGYVAAGIPLSAFTIQPMLTVDETYNSNVLAVESDAPDDAMLRVSPAINATSDWSNSLLTLNASADVDRYATLTTENAVNLNTSAYGWTNLSPRTRFSTVARYRTQRESREAQDVFVLTRRPVRYSNTVVGIGLSHRLANVLLMGEGDVSRTDFDDATRLTDGASVDEDFRDSTLIRARGRAEFGQSASLAYFVQGTWDQRRYRLRGTDPLASSRASQILEILGGARFELPILARGEIGIGYTRGSYRGARLGTFSGLAINAEITFFPTQLTNVTVSAERRVTDNGLPSSGGYVGLSGGVQVDHELRRAWLLGASARYQRDSFNGIDRNDTRVEVGASIAYRINRNLSARLNLSRIDLSSRGTDAYKNFVANRALVGVGFRL